MKTFSVNLGNQIDSARGGLEETVREPLCRESLVSGVVTERDL